MLPQPLDEGPCRSISTTPPSPSLCCGCSRGCRLRRLLLASLSLLACRSQARPSATRTPLPRSRRRHFSGCSWPRLGRAVSVGFSPIDDVSPLSRVGWLSREIRRVEIILSGNSRSRPMLCSFVATPCRNNGSSRPKFPLNREINREFAESGLKCDGLVFNHLGRSMACARIPCTTERRIVLR